MKRIWPLVLTCAAMAAVAQTPAVPETAGSAVPPAVQLPAQQSGGIKYLSGGAGEEERSQFLAQSAQFPLQLLFSGRQGEYAVADTVTVSNREGPLLTVASAGPLLMLNLPPGAYVVKASFNGVLQERALSVTAAPQKVSWNAPVSR